MAYFNDQEDRIFLQIMEGRPFQEIADENGLTLDELIEFKDIIIDKLNHNPFDHIIR